jgi:hypothetical protein
VIVGVGVDVKGRPAVTIAVGAELTVLEIYPALEAVTWTRILQLSCDDATT